MENNQIKEKPYIIEAVEDGVRVCVADEDFVIALHDAKGFYTWFDAIGKFGEDLPTMKQAHIIGAYHYEIQEKLKEAGGDPLDWWMWTRSEYYAYIAWLYSGINGSVNSSNKFTSIAVRPVRASIA